MSFKFPIPAGVTKAGLELRIATEVAPGSPEIGGITCKSGSSGVGNLNVQVGGRVEGSTCTLTGTEATVTLTTRGAYDDGNLKLTVLE